MFDITSYIMGTISGTKEVVIDSDDYIFTDANNDGNIVVTERS